MKMTNNQLVPTSTHFHAMWQPSLPSRLLLWLMLLASPAFPAPTIVTPTVYGLGTDVNQDNTADGFSVAATGSFRINLSYTPTSHNITRSLLHYDFTGITHVDTALFDFTAVGTFNANTYFFETYLLGGDSTLTLSDFNAAATLIAGQFGSTSFTQSIEVGSIINSALDAGATFIDIRHQIQIPSGGNPNNQSTFLEFRSSEFDSQSRPKLTLTGVVPEPASSFLLLLGTFFCCARRSYRQPREVGTDYL